MGPISGGSEFVRLKRLGTRNLHAALEKAEKYRALNEPEEAESICRDILSEDPVHQDALRTLGHQGLGVSGSDACIASIGSVQGVAIDLRTGQHYGAPDQRREGTVIKVPHPAKRKN